MAMKRLVIGALVGGIVLFVLGYLIFDMTFASFYGANAGSATGVDRSPQVLWAVVLGSLFYGALITFALEGRGATSSVGTGIATGAVVGFLLWGTADFILYGVTNIATLTRTVVDPILELVRAGVSGAAIALTLAKVR